VSSRDAWQPNEERPGRVLSEVFRLADYAKLTEPISDRSARLFILTMLLLTV